MAKNSSTQILGLTAGRPKGKPVKISLSDRLFHIYIVGKSGTGKTTLLQSLFLQNARSGHGCCLLDPHGDLAEAVSKSLWGREFIYWDVADPEAGISFNPLRRTPPQYRTLAASGLLEAMKHLWEKAWGNSQEHILRNTFLALLEAGDATLSDVLRMFNEKTYRKQVLSKVTNESVLTYWREEFEKKPAPQRAQALAPIQNKIGALLADPLMQTILGGEGKTLSFRQAMDEGKIVIINLAKGRLGSDTSGLLGAMLVSTIGLAAFSRADTPEKERKPFFLYADEFQNFTTLSFSVMLSELRKFKIGLVLAHQYLFQLSPEVREAVFGNCGTLISFRVGASDAPYLAREFQPQFNQVDLMRLPNYRIYLKLMIKGAPSKPFSAGTLPSDRAFEMSRNPFCPDA